ncbi:MULTISPECIES: hypothetical protein [unclassified Streptomyces]|uniref:hypothetical protein n=1 Tax=unclassified Streptomyces TaxID=2593676 RepID=UPI001BEB6609|nr:MULTISPECIES: hypothetical protein [unclassified Streptomyces]MBT2402415.1 hypothetical protein [Streptomyces sp. ISL-21]MBT2611535.1 hypothetical protein [Streptomyces sp. ISL-87]
MSQQFRPPGPDSSTPAAVAAQQRGPARTTGAGRGIAGALLATLVAAAAYGWVLHRVEEQARPLALVIGILVGAAAGHFGGRHRVIPPAAAVLSLAAVYLGQLLALALAIGDLTGAGLGEVVGTLGLGGLQELWLEATSAYQLGSVTITAVVAFVVALKIPSAAGTPGRN